MDLHSPQQILYGDPERVLRVLLFTHRLNAHQRHQARKVLHLVPAEPTSVPLELSSVRGGGSDGSSSQSQP
eukprot:675940-Amphidinium_carterae.1